MKRGLGWIIYMLAGLAMAIPNANADEARLVEVGGKLGVGATTASGPGANDQVVSSANRLTFVAGGAAGLRLHKLLAAQIEILYTSKGPKVALNDIYFGTYHSDYIEIPFLMKVLLPVHGKIEYYATVGPTLSLLLDADLELADGTNIDLTNAFESIDFGFAFGVGAAWHVSSNGAMTADIRYDRGITNVDKEADENDEVMNRAVYVMLGYRY